MCIDRCSPDPIRVAPHSTTSRPCCSRATCRRRKSQRSWSNPSRVKAGTSCRRTDSCRACARCVIARKAHMEKWQRGAHGNTFGGNPICCAAALATLDLVQGEYAANAAQVGDYCIGRLRALQSQFECIGEVRGKGLMIGVELIADRASRKPASALCQRLLTRAFHNGLLLLSCGVSTLRIVPPLMVSRANIDEALSLLQLALQE